MSVDDLPAAGNPAALRSPVPGVELWWCPLERSAAEIERLSGLLSTAELARAARFGTDALRARYVAGRATLRQLLGQRLAMPPQDVPIRRGARGRPELEFADAPDFNVTHTRGVGLIAIGDVPRIGVDIEHFDRSVAADKLARKFLTPREAETLAPLSPDDRRRAFLRHWTCKEAMSKATGDGLAAPFGKIEIALGTELVVVDGPPPYSPGGWRLEAITVPSGFLATIAVWLAAGR